MKKFLISLLFIGFLMGQEKKDEEKSYENIKKETDKEYIIEFYKVCEVVKKVIGEKLGFFARFAQKTEIPFSLILTDTTGEPLKNWKTILELQKGKEKYRIFLYSTNEGRVEFGIYLNECIDTKVRLIIPKNGKKKINIQAE